MPFHLPTPARRARSARAPVLRRLTLIVRRIRRLHRRLSIRLLLFGGWTWVAAGSLVGFEMLDVVFGSLLLAPEILPLVILVMALTWYFRERLRRRLRRLRARLRVWRMRRRAARPATGR